MPEHRQVEHGTPATRREPRESKARNPSSHIGHALEQIGKAVVALEPGCEVGAEELIAFCKERVAGYKCPRSVDFVGELPKSTVGKILRREVRSRYSEGRS